MGKGKRVLRSILKVILAIVGFVLLIYGCLLLSLVTHHVSSTPRHYASDNPFIQDTPLVSAHRMGGGEAPEESLLALEKCLGGKVMPGILELDLQLTKDGHLVLLHDETLDRTTDSVFLFGRERLSARDLTLDELKRLNIGVSYRDEEGNYPYGTLHGDDVPDALRILTIDEILDYTQAYTELNYIIEIKNGGEDGMSALDQLHALLEKRNLLGRTIFGTFHNEVSFYCRDTYPDIIRSASVEECVEFFKAMLLGRKDYHPSFSVLQVFYGKPYFKYGVNLASVRFINYAHSLGIATQYWTVNEDEDIRYLERVGADAIITDYVEKATQLLIK